MIVLRTKGIEFQVTYINLREPPEWFAQVSPHEKVPVLSVDGQPLFESNAIAEFLEESFEPRLHPRDAIKRARNRAWTDFVPDFAASIRAVNYATDDDALAVALETAREHLEPVENAIASERGNDGPFFNGPDLALVDAAYAPFFQRFAFIERHANTGLLGDFPLVQAWSDALLADERVTGSVSDEFPDALVAMLHRIGARAARYFEAPAAAG